MSHFLPVIFCMEVSWPLPVDLRGGPCALMTQATMSCYPGVCDKGQKLAFLRAGPRGKAPALGEPAEAAAQAQLPT